MSKILTREVVDKVEWESFLLDSNPRSFLQSWNWGEVNNALGHKVVRAGFYKGNKLKGVGLFIEQRARRGPHFIVPAGPIIDWNQKELVEVFFEYCKKLLSENKFWFVRIRPQVEHSEDLRKIFSDHGLFSSPMYLHGEHTLILNIDKSEEEILSQMRKNTRYLVKKSLNMPFKLGIHTDPSKTKILSGLQEEAVKRYKFVGFDPKLFEKELEVFAKDNQGCLFTCSLKGEVLVAALVIFYDKTAFYHFSGSSEKARGIPASYFLQWSIIQKARQLGCRYYDFWGIAPTENPKHRFAGVTIFKKGFGGTRIDWVHAHDLPVSKLYWSTYLFEIARKYVRRV